MQWLAFGVAIAVSMALLLRWLATASPAQITRGLWRGAIAVALLILLGLVVSGRLHWLLGLMGWLATFAFGLFARGRPDAAPGGPTRGQGSRVRTRFLDMSLDHDTGVLDGTVIEGTFCGRQLSSMSLDDLQVLLREAAADADTVNVLIAYLDRVHGETWRRAAGDTKGYQESDRGKTANSVMTRKEAFRVLGLSPGASDAEIRAAHRRLMKQLHPDHGGSDYLAAKINEAKEVLLGQ